MSFLWIAPAVLLSLAFVLYAFLPLFDGAQDGGNGEETIERRGEDKRRLLDAKERALRSLKDLEFDFTMGKVSRDDYERSYAELSHEVALILRELSG